MSSGTLTDTSRHQYRLRNGFLFPLVLAGIAGLVVVPMLALRGDHELLWPLAIFSPVVAGLVWWALRARLVLENNQLTVTSMLQTRVIDASEIDGIRTYSSRNGTYRALCLKRGGNPVNFTQYATDDAMSEWLRQFPDLDARDREEALQRISEDQELGATPEERMQALPRAKAVFVSACVAAGAAAIGYSFAPAAWRLGCFAVLALIPVVACFLLYRSPALYALGKNRADPRADLTLLLLISGFGLFFRGIGLNYVSSEPLLADGVLVCVVFLIAFFPAAMRGGQLMRALVPLCMIAGFSACGLVTGLNTVIESAPPVTFAAIVAGKHVRHGKSTTYYLTLEPWGPFAEPRSMQVSAARYEESIEGQTVCVLLHQGYLRVSWYEPVDCPQSPTDAPMR
ncbi:MAG TPA: hypothetical protein VME68_02165 [Acidobacteriaceae bacterium]|nr:hypothetical protein [Acidobacteriaceae bacterium]